MPLHKAPRGLRSITVQPAVSSLTHLTTKDQAYSELSTWRLRSNPILDGGQGKSAQSFLPCPRSPHIVPTEPLVEKGTQLRRTPDVLPTSTQNIHLGPLCDVQPTGHGGDYATNHIAKLPTHDAPHVATSRRVLPANRARCAGIAYGTRLLQYPQGKASYPRSTPYLPHTQKRYTCIVTRHYSTP